MIDDRATGAARYYSTTGLMRSTYHIRIVAMMKGRTDEVTEFHRSSNTSKLHRIDSIFYRRHSTLNARKCLSADKQISCDGTGRAQVLRGVLSAENRRQRRPVVTNFRSTELSPHDLGLKADIAKVHCSNILFQ